MPNNQPAIVGILNVTGDSFSDGGKFLDLDRAVEHGINMVGQGAQIIDIGGESTRPGSQPICPNEQIKRVAPVIERLAKRGNFTISVDTTSSKVSEAALDAGASIINDISALRFDGDMTKLAADRKATVILMHMQGRPSDMQAQPSYKDVLDEVKQFLAQRIEYAISCGIERDQLVVDPGIGFGKTVEHNLTLLRRLGELGELGVPLMIGTSRKGFIGKVLEIEEPAERLMGTAATVALAVAAGAQMIRVHDVKEMAQVAKMAQAICRQGKCYCREAST